MPVDAVKEEIARYNTFVANKLDEDFKKPIPDDAQTIDEPPFYACACGRRCTTAWEA